MMWNWQEILVYLILALAVAYLIRKFIWNPSASKKRKLPGGCGEEDCGCH